MTDRFPDEEFLLSVVKSLVEFPEAVSVTRSVDEMGVLLEVAVHPDDMGKVIGRAGATAKALRTVLRVVGMKHGARVNMKILEPEPTSMSGGERERGGIAGDDVIRDLKNG